MRSNGKGLNKGKTVSLLLLLLYISFKPYIKVHKTNKTNDLTSEMNCMINKKSPLQSIIF